MSASHAAVEESLWGLFNSAPGSVTEGSGKTFVPVSPPAICCWLRTYFGHGTPEYTTIQPHRTDVCSECEQLTGDIDSLRKSIERHMQQRGDMSVERLQDVDHLKYFISDLEAAVRVHTRKRLQTLWKIKRRRQADPSTGLRIYQHYSAQLNRLAVTHRRAEIFLRRNISKAASGFRFNLSSDYQQGKHCPQWNFNSQPSPTYFMPKRTLFVHIFIAESLEETEDESKLKMNRIYVREERVCGSKTSKDTVHLFRLPFGS